MVYVVSAFLFGIACAAALLFVTDRAVKKEKRNATEPATVGRRFYAAVLRDRTHLSLRTLEERPEGG